MNKKKIMGSSKSIKRLFYENLRLHTKDTFEAIHRLSKICTDESTHYVFINDHIGDFIIAIGYLRAFRLKNNIKKIEIVITDRYRDFSKHYESEYDKITFIPRYDLYRIFLLGATTFGEQYLIKEYPNVTFINPADSLRLGFNYMKQFPNMNLEQMIRCGCYGLGNNAEFISLPKVKRENSQLHYKNALLTLESRTVGIGIKTIYERIAIILKSLGYSVYTNAKRESECINGTLPVYKEIYELRDFIGNGAIVGVRCGLHDLMMYQDCKVVAIYPKDGDFGNLFTLDMLPNTKAAHIEIVQSGNDEYDCRKILGFIRR